MESSDAWMTRKQNFLYSGVAVVRELACFTGGKMNNAHCTVCCVYTLAPSTARSERVNAKILWINVDVKL